MGGKQVHKSLGTPTEEAALRWQPHGEVVQMVEKWTGRDETAIWGRFL